MRRILPAALLPATLAAASLAGPAAAGLPYPDAEAVETRAGRLEVRREDEGSRLFLAGRRVEGAGAWYLWVGRPFAYGAGEAVLVLLAEGGNACEGLFGLVILPAPGEAAFHGPFGSCSAELLDLRVTGGRIEVDVGAMRAALAKVTVVFDGRALAETEVPVSNAGAEQAGPGAAVRRWAGLHPADPFREAPERLRFLTIMTEAELFELADSVAVAGEAREAQGWVIGLGCFPHQCDLRKAGWAIRVSDGRPVAVIWDRGRARLFGAGRDTLPPPLRRLARTGEIRP